MRLKICLNNWFNYTFRLYKGSFLDWIEKGGKVEKMIKMEVDQMEKNRWNFDINN